MKFLDVGGGGLEAATTMNSNLKWKLLFVSSGCYQMLYYFVGKSVELSKAFDTVRRRYWVPHFAVNRRNDPRWKARKW